MTSYKVKYRLVIWLRNSRCLSKINVYVFSQRLWKGMFFVVSGPNRWMEPQTIVHSCNGTLRSKPEWNAHRIWAIKAVLSKGSQIQKRMQCGLHLHRNSRSGPMSLECGKKQISICPRSAVGLGLTEPVCEGRVWEDGSVPNLGFGGGYTGVCVCQKLIQLCSCGYLLLYINDTSVKLICLLM